MYFLSRAKRHSLFLIQLLLIVLVCTSFSKNKYKVTYLDSAPYSRKEYKNTARFYRCAGTGKSTDFELSHDKALFDAKKRLTNAICNGFDDNIKNDSNQLKQIFLKDVKITKEKVIMGMGHTNISWLIIKVKKRNIKANIKKEYSLIVGEEKNTRRFMKKFKKEMKKQKNSEY
jgi:hypothetical protein